MIRNKEKHMKQLKAIVAALVLAIGFSSCQKVIDVKLDEADKKVVIDAVITDQAGGCIVKVSQTKKFNESNDFNGLSGAQVSIKAPDGSITPLSETSTGIYKHASLSGQPGKQYELTVTVNGQTFIGTSVMPEAVVLDSIYIKTQKFFDEDETFSNVMFVDPEGERNYYRLLQFVNGEKSKGSFIIDDDLSDGKLFNTTLYFLPDDDEDKIKPGDMVSIEMQCVDASVYKYWFSLEQSSTGSSQSAAPSNPVSNISGGALGYFSAQVVSSMSVQAP